MGEVHDNPFHHANQARIVSDLKPDALVFEMIEPATARTIGKDVRGNAVALEAALGWADSGWPDFAMYFPIFAAAPDAAIYGGAVPKADVSRAVSDGAASVFGEGASLFGLDQPLPEPQLQTRLDLQQSAHCNALPEELLPGMVEAQRLRDAAIAKATLAAFEHARSASDTPQVVVITGNGHAREDWGAPAMLRHHFADAPDIEIVALGQFEVEDSPDMAFTSRTITEAAERDDPCAVFQK